MNLLKSIYISSYLMIAMGLMGYAVWMLSQGGNMIGWGGVLLTSAPIMVMISRFMIFKNMARTTANSPLIRWLALWGAFLAIWAWYDGMVDETVPILALLGMTGVLIYIFWYSKLNRRIGAKITIGEPLPNFTLLNVNNVAVSSKDLTDRPAILIFYRGNWCPLCMAQIKEIVKLYDEIRNLGVRVAFISPQPHDNTIALAKKFAVEFDFLIDKDNQAARILGIENPNGLPMGMQVLGYDSETVLPTVIITGEGGRVIWSHETDNYRVRPEPDVYLDVLRQSGISMMKT